MKTLSLPYPISANDFWRTFYSKRLGRCCVHPTDEAIRWKRDAKMIALAAGFRQPLRIPLALRLVHHHRAIVLEGKKIGQKNGHVFDLDNVLKVTIDALKAVVYDDDRQIKRLLVEYGEPTRLGGIDVSIEEFRVDAMALFKGFELAEISSAGEPAEKETS